MYADLLMIAVVLVLGIVAFVFGILHAVWRGFCLLIGLLVKGNATKNRALGSRRLVCTRKGCRKVEYRDAVYCSQCGAKLVGRRNTFDK